MGKKNRQAELQRRAARQARLLATCDRLQIPLLVAVQLLAGTLKEADLADHTELARWRAVYQEESLFRQAEGETVLQFKQAQVEQIAHLFGVTEQAARAVLQGAADPAELPARRLELRSTCYRLKVPAVVAAQVLAGVLAEEIIEQSPNRDRWQTEYQEEVELARTDSKKLKSHQARQIASAFGVPDNIARQVLNDKTKPAELVKIAQERRHKRQEEALHKRREGWLAQGITALVGLGLPQGMAQTLLGLPYKKQAWGTSMTLQHPLAALGAAPLQLNLDASPSDAATRYWLAVVQCSGFNTPNALIEAWQQYRVWTVEGLRQAKTRQIREANAGMLPEKVAALCTAEQIAETLHRLFNLNHWAKSRDRLLYVDRQGLYRVKARLIQEAYRAQQLRAVSYIAGKAPFEPFGRGVFTDCAVEWFAEVLQDSFVTHTGEKSSWDPLYPLARQLYQKAMGREATTPESPDLAVIEAYIQRRLVELQAEASHTRQPILVSELKALFLSPDDIEAVGYDENGGRRFKQDSPGWDELDEAELRPLDPENLSLIGFRYEAPTARYIFHLPLRVAERFVPASELEALRTGSESTREAGEFYGREITAEESLAYPIRDLLAELGVEIELVCLQGLVDKQEYVTEKTRQRWPYYHNGYDDWDEDFADDYEEDPGDDLAWPSQKQDGHNKKLRLDTCCPVCQSEVEPNSRLAHWQEAHFETQAVTVSRAAWLMGMSPAEFETLNLAPDYRDDSNTRQWRVETLAIEAVASSGAS